MPGPPPPTPPTNRTGRGEDELSSLIGQGVYAPGRVTGITDLGDDHWEVTLAQGANEQQEIVLAADSFDGPWLLKEVRSVS